MESVSGPPDGATLPLGVAIVGLRPKGGWAADAHLPAIREHPGFAVRAAVGRTTSTIVEAAARHSITLALVGVEAAGSEPSVDLIAITTRVPEHDALVRAALATEKAVFCEWPLAKNHTEAEALSNLSGAGRLFVGLQGRAAPSVRYLGDLIAEGAIGTVLSTTLQAAGGVWGREVSQSTQYLVDRENGADLTTIPLGHISDLVEQVLGAFEDLHAVTAIRQPVLSNVDTGAEVTATAADQVAVTGILASGAVASLHVRGGASPPFGFHWEIHGSDGALVISAPTYQAQFGSFEIQRLDREGGAEYLPVPPEYDWYPELRGSPAHAVAHAYELIRRDIEEGGQNAPRLHDALARHRFLHRVAEAAQRRPSRP